MFYTELMKNFSEEALRASATSSPALSEKTAEGKPVDGGDPAAFTYTRLMQASYDGVTRYKLDDHFKKWVRNSTKLGTDDVGGLLVDSISSRRSFLRRVDTPLLNVIRMFTAKYGKNLELTDYLYRVNERRIGDLRASRINMESDLSTTPKQTVQQQKEQVLTFWGDRVQANWVTSSQASMQRAINLMEEESDAQLERIDNAQNYDYWNSELQTSFTNGNVPALGGLLSRITTNTHGMSNGDIDNPTLEEDARTLGTFTNPNLQKMIWCGDKQIDEIRDNEINRHDGNNPDAFARWEREMGKQFAEWKIPYSRVYEFTQGPAAPVAHDPDLTQTSMVIMTLDPKYVPLEVAFKISGKEGPFIFILPSFDARDAKFIADGRTLDDAGEESRLLITALATYS